MSVSIVDTSLYQLVKPEACNIVNLFISKASQGERKSPDPQIRNTWKVVRAAENTAIAPYHYLWRSSVKDSGVRQAQIFAGILETLLPPISNMRWNGRPLVWLDVDPVYSAGGEPVITQAQMENLITQFIISIRELLDAEVGIYTSRYAWTSVTSVYGTTDIPIDRPLWVSNPGATTPAIPYDWSSRYGAEGYDLWQYSFTGKIPGIMKPNQPTIQASVDLDRARVDTLKFVNMKFGMNLQPKPFINIPPPSIIEQPERVEIEMSGGLLNLRASPFGTIVAKTFDGAQFPVIGQATDNQGRPWLKIAPEMYVASWYCKAV